MNISVHKTSPPKLNNGDQRHIHSNYTTTKITKEFEKKTIIKDDLELGFNNETSINSPTLFLQMEFSYMNMGMK